MSTQELLLGVNDGVFGQALNLPRLSEQVDRLRQISSLLNIQSLLLCLFSICLLSLMVANSPNIVSTPYSYSGAKGLNKLIDNRASGTSAHQVNPSTKAPACSDAQTYYESSFSDCPSFDLNFNKMPDGPLSSSFFNIENGPPGVNEEAEYYSNSTQNLRIENGALVLEALNQSEDGFKYTSARINTAGKEDFLYGKIVVRAELPASIGTWPAIWMLPTNYIYKNLGTQIPNRDLNDGELDIAETVGTQAHTIYGISHNLSSSETGTGDYYATTNVPDSDSAFHDYSLSWTPTSLSFAVDNKVFYTMTKQPGADYKTWPFNQPFNLILNLAIGGSWGGTDTAQYPGDGVDTGALPAYMRVASIDYYSYKAQ